MINRIVIAGRLTKDPELRKSANDLSVASFSIAVDDFSQKDETGKPIAMFFNVTVWGNQADVVAKNCRKGNLICVDGRISLRKYVTKSNSVGTAVEIRADSVQFLEPKSATARTEDSGYVADVVPESAPKADSKNLDSVDVVDEDLPF